MANEQGAGAAKPKGKSNAWKLALIFGLLIFAALPFMARQSVENQSLAQPTQMPESLLAKAVRSYFSASIPSGWSVDGIQSQGALTVATLNVPNSFASSLMSKPVSGQQLMIRSMCPSSLEPSYTQLQAIRGRLRIALTSPADGKFFATECGG